MKKQSNQKNISLLTFTACFSISVLIGMATIFTFLGCSKPPNKQSDLMFTLGLELFSLSRGHEDITRFSVQIANEKISNELNFLNFYPSIPSGTNASNSEMPMVAGLYDTDWAITLTGVKKGTKLIELYGAESLTTGKQWQEHEKLQSIHFLRNSLNGQIQTIAEAITTSLANISMAFELASTKYNTNKKASLYYLGHALHILQDSFSQAHTKRSGDLRTIENVCVYGIENVSNDICMHPKLFIENGKFANGSLFGADRVWKEDNLKCNLFPNERGWDCLKPEAQAAANAGAGLLYLFAKNIETSQNESLETILNSFFTNTSVWNGGYFQKQY